MILNTIKKPYEIFADINSIEYDALEQFANTMNNDHVIRGALMPDVHTGYTVPIGCVFESDGYIFPEAIGFDIGCGMCAVPTSFNKIDVEIYKNEIYNEIIKSIPLGYNHREYPVHIIENFECTLVMRDIYNKKNGNLQIGTLGGGNHFIEIGYGEDDRVWIIVHSGSRGVGHGCASYYMNLAKMSDDYLKGFDVNSSEGEAYITDMQFCLDFALLNRKTIIEHIASGMLKIIFGSAEYGSMINRNHNHAETKDGIKWVHRKGATHAEYGMLGVIPGNMKSGSFIVEGKGCFDSLYSSSHGAGRVMSRKKAKDMLSMEEFEECMKGIKAKVSKSTIDESPMAYKDIYYVMERQRDLVRVIDHIKPIINVKG